MATTEKRNTAPVETQYAVPDFSSFVDEQTGFPPYWKVTEANQQIYALPIARDERDPNFPRYMFKALMPTTCSAGPADDAEEVKVKPGELFTCSTYGALPLDLYIAAKIPVLIIAGDKVKIKADAEGKPRTMWKFRVRISPEDKKVLDGKRAELLKQLAGLGVATPAQQLAAQGQD